MRKFDNVAFPDPLRLKYPPGEAARHGVYNWILEQDFRVVWSDGGKQYQYVAARGMTTDMSSIPWWAQGIPGLQKAGKSVKASIVHDHIYENRPEGWTRAEADLLLYRGLRASGRNWLTAQMMYRAVRLGGKTAWDT